MSTDFEVSKTDGHDGYEWRLTTAAHGTAAKGQGYATRDDAMDGAEAVKKAIGEATVTDTTDED